MKKLMAVLTLGLLLAALSGCESIKKEEPPRLIPMKEFFKNPEKASYQLSPDGEHISFMQPWQSRMNIFVQPADGSTEPVRVTEATARDIAGYAWATNDRLVFIQDKGGDENYHAFVVGLDGSNPLELTPFDGVRAGIVDRLENDDEHMLISMNQRNPRVFDVFKVNIETGEMKMVAENPGNITGWITDHNGEIRAATVTDGVVTKLLYRTTSQDEFRVIKETSFKDKFSCWGFTYDNTKMWVGSNIDRDTIALYEYDPETDTLGEKPLYEHPDVDLGGLITSDKEELLLGVRYTTHKTQRHYFELEGRTNPAKERRAKLEGKLPGYDVAVTSANKDEDKFFVITYSDRSKGVYYFYDEAADKLEKVVELAPWLKEEELAPMKPIQFESSDGLTIHGYLTLPVGVEPKDLPMVLVVHGGPWARDHWGFNSEAQLLANRGYAVLQLNFRGSTGYGKAFWQASFKEWGKSMQRDLTEGVEWLVGQGIVDKERVGIYGGSYGGYAVLAGLAFTPEVYKCGVDYVGVANLFTLLNSLPPYWESGRQMFYEMMGDPEADKELLEEISPVFHADKIVAPLFIAQGANDPRVKKAESDQMVEALRARGVEVPYMVKADEGHGFRNEENRFDFYGAMEKFLAEHLDGRTEAPAEAPADEAPAEEPAETSEAAPAA